MEDPWPLFMDKLLATTSIIAEKGIGLLERP
jgi:hypothetical protein